MNGDDDLAVMVGRTVNAILMSEDRLTFQTDDGLISYDAYGDCCSRSYFFDFYGVKNLLENGPVVAFEKFDLAPGDPGYHSDTEGPWDAPCPECGVTGHGYLQVYGYRFTTEHPNFGPVTSVFSFRNDSNGYYGGSLERYMGGVISADQVLITEDQTGS